MHFYAPDPYFLALLVGAAFGIALIILAVMR